MNRRLIGVGAVLLVAGALLLSYLLISGPGAGPPSERVPLIGETRGRIDPPTRVWSIVAGLSMAAGAACIGIGMNRWGSDARVVPSR